MELTAVIVDDEPHGQAFLKEQLSVHCPQVTVAGIAGNMEEGIKLIRNLNPDLVFLDIRMPRGSGFDLLNALKERMFHLIFTTAHEEYALKAFEYAAVDYLLKPIHPRRLVEAVDRAKAKDQPASDAVQKLLQAVQGSGLGQQIAIPSQVGFEMVDVDKIVRLAADGSYCHIIMDDGHKVIVSKNLKEMERLLPEQGFYRIHQSHLINLKKIRRVVREDGGWVHMQDGSELEISRRKRLSFFQFLQSKS